MIENLGCGASCVYGLLGYRMNNWNFTCTEIDEESYRYAVMNVQQNEMQDHVKGTQKLFFLTVIGRSWIFLQ